MHVTMRPAAIQLLATALTTGFILEVQPSNHLSYIWPLTALQLAIAWNHWNERNSRMPQLFAAFLGYVAASVWHGWSPLLAAEMGCVQTAEVWATLAILRPRISRFADLKQLKLTRLFGVVAVVVPLVTAAFRAVVFHSAIQASLLLTWFVTGMSHSVGLLAVTPALLFVLSRVDGTLKAIWTNWRLGLAVQLLVLMVTVATFRQITYPLLFLVLPPVVLAVLVSGLEGAALSGLIVTMVACWATALHHGPLWLISGVSSGMRTATLQVFLAMVVGTALPVGALLDEREAAAKEIRKGQSIYRTLLDHSKDMILLSSMDGSTRYVSPGVEAISGWTPAEFLSFLPMETMHEDDRPLARGIIASLRGGKTEHHFRYRIRCKDGRYQWAEASMLGYSDGSESELTGFVATIRDISALARREQSWSQERNELAQENKSLQVLAGNDELTGIANRRTFNRIMAHEVSRHKRAANSLSLLMIDVDFFKKYNDQYGHPMGDEVLKSVAEVLVESSRESDLAARVGGEEFAVLLPDTDVPGAFYVAERILERIVELQVAHRESPFGHADSQHWIGDLATRLRRRGSPSHSAGRWSPLRKQKIGTKQGELKLFAITIASGAASDSIRCGARSGPVQRGGTLAT